MRQLNSLAVLLAVVAGTAAVSAQGQRIRLATIAPTNSEWHNALREWRQSVQTATGNRVAVQLYEGGRMGSENAAIERMRIPGSTVNAALLTAVGLSHIDEAFNVFGLPFFFASDEEMRHVRDRLTPMLGAALEERGFHLLCWGEGGWVQLFSKEPLRTLDDVKDVKLYTSEGNDRMVQWYKSNGFTPIAMPETEIVKQLSSLNGVEAVPIPPYPAEVQGLYKWTKYMLDIRVAPLVGAIVVTRDEWARIDEMDRQAIAAAARAFEKRIGQAMPTLDRNAIGAMQEPGRDLTVIRLDPTAAAAFHAEADKLLATAADALVPEAVFKAAVRERAAYRTTHR